MENKISYSTRKNLFDIINLKKISYCGDLKEVGFLSRIFNLRKLSSTDPRFKNAFDDIKNHTENFIQDYDDDWYIYRFNLLGCDDKTFCDFICEMLHPIVRSNIDQKKFLYKTFNEILAIDSFELIPTKNIIVGHPVFKVTHKLLGHSLIEKSKKEILNELSNTEYVEKQIMKMESAIYDSPLTAIGTAKELIETVCKTILKEKEINITGKIKLAELFKETTKLLKLTPENINNEAKTSKTIKSILGGLMSIVHGMAELRNEHGDGHGKETNYKGLTSRHAKLSVYTCLAIVNFLLETHQYHQNKKLFPNL